MAPQSAPGAEHSPETFPAGHIVLPAIEGDALLLPDIVLPPKEA